MSLLVHYRFNRTSSGGKGCHLERYLRAHPGGAVYFFISIMEGTFLG
ncbi:hypothetical protein MSL71_35200 [Desulfoluna butyratoxydans]|uniref:Uncharacterized protein n=1 Tax=Desulfoluna butyratoxydans TaxID=231438 RepID=A0A4V6ILP0_9BACT|nr:hypothetical protein MSL71_35200 [Desulfoluna butyratoxydans]